MPSATEKPPFELIVELARTDKPGDPYAFRFEPQTYNLRKPDGTYAGAAFPWDDALLADLTALQRARQDPAVRQRLGERLRTFLGAAGWEARGEEILAAAKDERAIHVTLRSEAAELHALPWELTTLRTGQHLAELPGCLVRYEWPGTETAKPAPDPPAEGGRILFAWSAAGGAVPAAEHLQALRRACEQGHLPFDEDRDVVSHVSLASLRRALAEPGAPVAVLHVLCHGGRLASGTEVYGLVWDASETGDDPEKIGALELRKVLAPHVGTLRLVVLAACHGASAGAPGNALGGVAQALHRIGVPAVVASRQPLSVVGSIAIATVLYDRLLVGLASLESAFLAAREKVAEDATHNDWAALQLYARAADGPDHRPVVFRPYRGLLAFHGEHARWFFGREREVGEAVGALAALVEAKRPRLLVVTGASGTGKSSLVFAGVVPALQARDGGRWKVVSLRPRDGLPKVEAAVAEKERPLLLVVDQFEELFTDVDDKATREALVRRLWALAGEEGSGVSVLVTLRVDYLGRCGEIALGDDLYLEGVAYQKGVHSVFVERMARAGLGAAIARPAEKVGLALDDGLVTQMLADAGNEPGALPLVEYTLDQMWLGRAREGERYALTLRAYQNVGGMSGALTKKADGLLEGLDDVRRRAARRLLVQLVDTRGEAMLDTRRRLRREKLRRGPAGEEAVLDEVLDALARERLVVVSEEGVVEIAHEELVRQWGTLRGWMEEDRMQREALAPLRTWVEAGNDLTGDRLAQARGLLEKYPDEIGTEERALIERSEASVNREKQKRKAHDERIATNAENSARVEDRSKELSEEFIKSLKSDVRILLRLAHISIVAAIIIGLVMVAFIRDRILRGFSAFAIFFILWLGFTWLVGHRDEHRKLVKLEKEREALSRRSDELKREKEALSQE